MRDGALHRSSGAVRRRALLRILLAVAALLGLVYGGALLWLATQETRLVFRAGRALGPSRPPFHFEQVDVPRPDGARQFAWMMPNARSATAASDLADLPFARTWVLYLHGNGATVASRANIARYRGLHEMGLDLLAPEYRGFAGLDGVPSERALAGDARAAYTYLTTAVGADPSRVVVYGWSLGSAVAVQLAAEVETGAVILEGAPASAVAIGESRYPLFPIRWIMRNRFESIHRIERVRAPLLFLHSPEDAIVPFGEGRRLYEAARAPKRFVEVRGGHVYANEVDRETFFGAIRTFLDELGLLPPLP